MCEVSSVAQLAFSSSGLCLFANRSACHLFGIDEPEQISELKLESMVPTQERSSARVRMITEETFHNEGLHEDLLVKRPNGPNLVAHVGVRHLEIEAERVLLLMIQDITIQKKLQRDLLEKQSAIHNAYQELLEQNKKLKELDIAKNRFIALTTHELRTPLSAMIASAEVLKLKLYDTEEQMAEFVEMIYDQGQHLSQLINDILDFARIQAGRMDFYIGQKNLADLVTSQVEALQTMAANAKITMNFEPYSGPALCYYDDVRLTQVLDNIINNAIKYNKPQGSVRVWLEDHDGHYSVHVEDTGRGISEEDVKKVFDEFETLGKVAQHHKGTGLGMPISKRLIEGMGGSIQLTSQPGVGSTFWITLPKSKVLAPENYRERNESFDLAA